MDRRRRKWWRRAWGRESWTRIYGGAIAKQVEQYYFNIRLPLFKYYHNKDSTKAQDILFSTAKDDIFPNNTVRYNHT